MTRRSPYLTLLAIVVVAALAYTVFFTWLSLERHQALMTHTADLGQIDLAVWNTLHGRFVQEVKGEEISTRLTDHFEPIFWPVSVVFGLWDDASALLALQAAVLGLTALVVWATVAVSGHGLSQGTAMAAATWAALAYLAAPQAEAATVADFHASPLAVLPLALLLYLGRRKLTAPALVAAVAALAVKEEIALVVAVAGLYLALISRWRPGFLITALAVTWFAVATLVIIPHYSAQCYGEARFPYLARYDGTDQVGTGDSSLLSLARTAAGRLLERDRLLYVAGLLAAFGGAPLLAPEVAIVASPLIAANVLSQYEAQYSGEFHYSAPFMSVLAIAAGIGAMRAFSWARGHHRKPALFALALPLVLIPFAYHIFEGFTPLGAEYWLHRPSPDHPTAARLDRFSSQIPGDASLSVTPALHPHFSHRERIYTFPALGGAEYVLIDVAGTTDMHPADLRRQFDGLQDRGYGVVDAADGMVLLREGASTAILPDQFFDFARASSTPMEPLDVTFGTTLRLLGYSWVDDAKWGYTSLRLYWQPLGPPPSNLAPYAILTDRLGQPVADTRAAPFLESFWYPVAAWRPGETLITTTVAVPLGNAWGAYVGVIVDGNYDDPAARLTPDPRARGAIPESNLMRVPPVQRASGRRPDRLLPHTVTPPSEADPLLLGGWLWLEGAQVLEQSPHPGGTVDVVTYWSRTADPAGELALSLRLLGASGDVVAQSDGPIQNGLYPPAHWGVGETVPNLHHLALPADLTPGVYSLAVIAYDRLTGSPLLCAGSEGPVLLGTVTVAARDVYP